MDTIAAALASPQPRRRPLLRGWSHLLAAFVAAIFTIVLVQRTFGDGPRAATMALYGLSSVLLYACSAIYHVVTWSPGRRRIMRSLDHGNIYVVIAATTTAIGANILTGWERILLLAAVWVVASIGVLVAVFHVRLSSVPRVCLYIGTGLTGVVALPGLLGALPATAVVAMVVGGVLYAVGGVIYAMKRPNPFPTVFGYHEIFHLLVIAGWTAFAYVVWIWVVPFNG